MSSHPIAQALCQHGPITSTSANFSGQTVLTTAPEIESKLGEQLDGIIDIAPFHQPPSKIIDLLTGQQLR